MEEKGMFEIIKESFSKTKSINDTSAEVGVSKNTVQRVLITEGLWESKRSREIVELFKQGYSAQEIADKLVLSLKCVQNYMPYTKGMHNQVVTENSKKSKAKRERMKIALLGQKNKFELDMLDTAEGVIKIDKGLIEDKGVYERMEKIENSIINSEYKLEVSAKKYIPSVLKLQWN